MGWRRVLLPPDDLGKVFETFFENESYDSILTFFNTYMYFRVSASSSLVLTGLICDQL